MVRVNNASRQQVCCFGVFFCCFRVEIARKIQYIQERLKWLGMTNQEKKEGKKKHG